MALATQCPHCNTTFRVASDQLKLRGGIVRCGACHEVFDGNATLVDDGPAPSRRRRHRQSLGQRPRSTSKCRRDRAVSEKIARTRKPHAIYTLDFDTTLRSLRGVAESRGPRPAGPTPIDFDRTLNLEPPEPAAAVPRT
jgi:predicted Zn finger-like uncharacterized protein